MTLQFHQIGGYGFDVFHESDVFTSKFDVFTRRIPTFSHISKTNFSAVKGSSLFPFGAAFVQPFVITRISIPYSTS